MECEDVSDEYFRATGTYFCSRIVLIGIRLLWNGETCHAKIECLMLQLDALRDMLDDHGKALVNNYRKPQPLNGRVSNYFELVEY